MPTVALSRPHSSLTTLPATLPHRRGGAFRICPAGPLFAENKFALFGIESVGGYHPAKLKLYEESLAKTENLSSINVLRLLKVGYIVMPSPLVPSSVRTGQNLPTPTLQWPRHVLCVPASGDGIKSMVCQSSHRCEQ